MIPEIVIQESPEFVYNLMVFDINAELILSEEVKYILTPESYFPFSSISDFVKKDNKFILINDDNDIFSISEENFEMISDLLKKE